jgi:uncharacterized protein YecT (DUF1311 family)
MIGLCRTYTAALICGLNLSLSLAIQPSHAQTRKPTTQEIAAIHDCAAKNRDDVSEGERQCVFNLVAEPCINTPGHTANLMVADCYRVEGLIWDELLNANYRNLLAGLDQDQTAKARAMQRAWIAYRDTTCQFYDDKIHGSMAITMHAACVTRETARRALLIDFFSRL